MLIVGLEVTRAMHDLWRVGQHKRWPIVTKDRS
jgi:hypothetical protein